MGCMRWWKSSINNKGININKGDVKTAGGLCHEERQQRQYKCPGAEAMSIIDIIEYYYFYQNKRIINSKSSISNIIHFSGWSNDDSGVVVG